MLKSCGWREKKKQLPRFARNDNQGGSDRREGTGDIDMSESQISEIKKMEELVQDLMRQATEMRAEAEKTNEKNVRKTLL